MWALLAGSCLIGLSPGQTTNPKMARPLRQVAPLFRYGLACTLIELLDVFSRMVLTNNFRIKYREPLARPAATLSPSDGERDGVRGRPEIIFENQSRRAIFAAPLVSAWSKAKTKVQATSCFNNFKQWWQCTLAHQITYRPSCIPAAHFHNHAGWDFTLNKRLTDNPELHWIP